MPALFAHATPVYFLAALGWGLLLFFAFAGWGAALAGILSSKEKLDTGLKAALGLALTVALGGLFNLLSLISRTGVLLWVVGGAGCFAVDSLRRKERDRAYADTQPRRFDPLAFLAFVFVGALALLLFAGSVDGKVFDGTGYRDFDPHDDEQAYLAFPEKMLRIGGLGADPFDARRLNVLGGQSLLHAFVAVFFPPRTTHLLDAGVGLLISLAVLWGAARKAGLTRAWASAPLLVLLLLPAGAARGNTTALFTGVALLVALYRLVEEEPFGGAGLWARAVAPGLVFAALVALKTTFLPAAALFIAFDAFLSIAAGKGTARFREALATAALAAAFLSPWMLSLKLSSGTFLFPLLGRGVQRTIPWAQIPGIPPEALAPLSGRAALLRESLSPMAPLALLAPLVWLARHRTAPVAFGLAAFVLPALLRFAGDPYLSRSLYRYGFPAFAAALAVLVSACLPRHLGKGNLLAAAALAVAAYPVMRDFPLTFGTYRQATADIASAVSGRPLVDPTLASRSASLLSEVPAGAAVLTRVAQAYLLDPVGHRLLFFSMPGMSSPPPGMPFFEGPEAVARYLGEKGIRYLAYGERGDGSTLLFLREDDIRYRYPLSKSRWAILAFHRDFHRNVRELSFTRARLADRPDAVVLDLARRALRLPLTEAPERLAGFTSDGWTMGEARIRLDYERGEGDRFLRVVFPETSGARSLRVSLDGSPLPVASPGSSAVVFDLAASAMRLGELSLDGPPVEVLGVATVSRPEEAPRIGAPLQRVTGALELREAEWRSGFYPDEWTDGNGLVANLLWEPNADDTLLAVELKAGPPGPPEAADVRILANGIELPRLGVRDGTWSFRLLPGHPPIRRIRILSKTFVPREAGLNDDGRKLGVVVFRVRLGSGR